VVVDINRPGLAAQRLRSDAKKYSDGGGLYLLVTPKGARCWRYRYRFAKKDEKLSLGTYPLIALASARVAVNPREGWTLTDFANADSPVVESEMAERLFVE
jgi:hypothetical protein